MRRADQSKDRIHGGPLPAGTTVHLCKAETPDAVAEGKLRAAIQRAKNGLEVAAQADALAASIPDRLARTYISPSNKKGRQSFIIIPKEES